MWCNSQKCPHFHPKLGARSALGAARSLHAAEKRATGLRPSGPMSTTQRNGARTVTARPPREGCGCKPNKDGLCCATKACGCRKEGEECGPHCDCGGTFTAPAPLCDGHQLP